MNKLIGLTKISKGSSYGDNAKNGPVGEKDSSNHMTNGNMSKKEE